MAKSKKCKRSKAHTAATRTTYPQRAFQHAEKLAQDFAEVHKHIDETRGPRNKLPEAVKKKTKKAVESVVETGLSKGVYPKFPSKGGKKKFQNLIFNMISDLFSSTVPQEMFAALHGSFKCLFPQIQALELASQQLGGHPTHSTVITGTDQDTDSLLSTQAAKLSVDFEVANSTGARTSDDEAATSRQ